MAIADPKEKKTFAALFSSRKKRDTAPPRSPGQNGRVNTDFDRMLTHGDRTKKLTLSKPDSRATLWHLSPETKSPMLPMLPNSPLTPSKRQEHPSRSRPHRADSVEEAKVSDGKASFFSKNKDRVVRRVKTDEGHREKVRRQREAEVEFELHSASGISSPDDTSPKVISGNVKSKKAEEKWMGRSRLPSKCQVPMADSSRHTHCQWCSKDGPSRDHLVSFKAAIPTVRP